MTHSTFTSLSKLLTKKPQDRKKREAADQRLKSFPDQVPFAPSYLIHISPVILLPNKHVVGLIWRPESCIHWLFHSSMSALIMDTLWLEPQSTKWVLLSAVTVIISPLYIM